MKQNNQGINAKYKDLTFETEDKFVEWLKETATREIIFKNHRPELLSLWIDDEGEILNFNGMVFKELWLRGFVNINQLEIDRNILVSDPLREGVWNKMKFIVEEIIVRH